MFRLSLHAYHFSFGLGIRSAVYGKIGPSDVGRLRTRDKRDHGSDLINVTVAAECGGGLLWRCPLARRGVQLRVDRTWLNVVDRDATAPELSRQCLRKYSYRPLRGRVGDEAGRHNTLTHAGTDHDDATAI